MVQVNYQSASASGRYVIRVVEVQIWIGRIDSERCYVSQIRRSYCKVSIPVGADAKSTGDRYCVVDSKVDFV